MDRFLDWINSWIGIFIMTKEMMYVLLGLIAVAGIVLVDSL